MAYAIETIELTKEYVSFFGTQRVLALDNLNLAIDQGEIFGFIGPNGAGKTTTIKLLLGLIFPTKGKSLILGRRPTSVKAKQKVGYLPEGSYYHDFLKGDEVLRFYGKLYGLRGPELERKITHTLEIVGLQGKRDTLVRYYSKGMRQRIGLGQALLSDPDVLILDEPTVGLDPIARREIRDILVHLRDQGKTLFVCSHELTEVEMICDRIAILDKGKVIMVGPLKDLVYSKKSYEAVVRNATSEFRSVLQNKNITIEEQRGGDLRFFLPAEVAWRQKLMQLVDQGQAELLTFEASKESLEDLFLRAVKGSGETQ